MLVPYSWLKEFINLKVPAEQVGERLSLATIGVEGIKKEGGDYVLDLEVTFNRGDLLSIIGVARELATLYNLKLKGEEETFKTPEELTNLLIKTGKDLSQLYALALIKNLHYKETPKEMRKRLELAGMRSVNLFADITNYVMLEYGQPLHAFDAEKVKDRDETLSVEVRNAKQGETIKTLDGSTHNLKAADIVIADRRGPIAIAGVMGGEETEVTLNTREILLEAAIFDPVSIRKTAHRLGLQSEASNRFEHYLSPENLFKALNKAVKLYHLYGKGELGGFGQIGETKTKNEMVNLTKNKLDSLLGIKIGISEARKHLTQLGFKVMSSDKGLVAWPPHFRGDILFEEDLIEEVARLHGYEKLPNTPPATGAINVPQNEFEYLRRYLPELLAGLGFSEVRSYPFLNTKGLIHQNRKDLLRLKNPISAEAEYLRNSNILNLLESAQKNTPQYKQGKIFELEKIYPKTGEYFALTAICWNITKPYLTLKGTLELLLKKTYVDHKFIPTKHPFLHQKKAAKITINNKELGIIGEVHPHLVTSYGLEKAALFEIDLEELAKHNRRWGTYTPILKYPKVYEDFSFFLPYEKGLGSLIKRLETLDTIIKRVEMVDLFEQGKKRSITLQLTFQSDAKELSSKDIKPIREGVKKTIKRSGGNLRSGSFRRGSGN